MLKVQTINRTPFDVEVEVFGDELITVAIRAYASTDGNRGRRGACGDCGELRVLYLNPAGPIAICELCLLKLDVEGVRVR